MRLSIILVIKDLTETGKKQKLQGFGLDRTGDLDNPVKGRRKRKKERSMLAVVRLKA